MVFPNWRRWLQTQTTRRPRRMAKKISQTAQPLEQRICPAVTAVATALNEITVTVTGGETVVIAANGAGDLTVNGVTVDDGTAAGFDPQDADIITDLTINCTSATAANTIRFAKSFNETNFSALTDLTVSTGGGNDTITFDKQTGGVPANPVATNEFNGGEGNDTITGSDGDDAIDGGGGNDVLNGGDGLDAITGGNGNDYLAGGANQAGAADGDADVMDGEAGNDTVSSAGTDMPAAIGTDLYITDAAAFAVDSNGVHNVTIGANSAGKVTVNGFAQTTSASAVMSITINCDEDATADTDKNTVSLAGVTGGKFTALNTALNASTAGTISVALGGGNDTFTGSPIASTNTTGTIQLNGNDGNDTINGGAGGEDITGGEGNDVLNGNDGGDTINGDDGSDTMSGGNGNDSLDDVGAVAADNDELDGKNVLNGGAGDDTLDAGDNGDNLTGGNDADEITGGAGNDTINGQAGDDTIVAEDGRDNINGGDGADLIDGGLSGTPESDGADTINGGGGDDTIDGQEGEDSILGGGGDDILGGGEDNDTVNGQDGADTIVGNLGDDSLLGGNGDDAISGDEGNDNLQGQGGNDLLLGGDDEDALNGGAGSDTMSGQAGSDVVIGGGSGDLVQGSSGLHFADDGDDLSSNADAEIDEVFLIDTTIQGLFNDADGVI